MNKLINIVGIVVLCGILLKLSYVFVFLFSDLDDNSLISKITGVTFAFASVYFVVKVKHRWLKITMIALDMCTILYFYLHEKMNIPIDFASIIIAIYSGLIIYYLGRIVSEKLESGNESETDRLRNEVNRLRSDNELKEIVNDINRIRRRIADCKNQETKERHRKRLEELEKKYKELINDPGRKYLA